MAEPLPEFPYHRDPEDSGVVVSSDQSCAACGQARGRIYTGPIHTGPINTGPIHTGSVRVAGGEPEDAALVICPWCIGDGSAHEKLGVTFVVEGGVGGFGEWPSVPEDVVAAVTQRTPCFRGWQPERWFTCCDDAAEFWGPAGWREIQDAGSEAVRAIKKESGFEGEDWEGYYPEIDRDGEVRAYLFACRHCGALGGYSDCD